MTHPATTPPPAPPVHICIFATRATARLVTRDTTPGKPVAWPMLVTTCPNPRVDKFGNAQHHHHAHFMTEPGPPWLRLAPCSRLPYRIYIEAAA